MLPRRKLKRSRSEHRHREETSAEGMQPLLEHPSSTGGEVTFGSNGKSRVPILMVQGIQVSGTTIAKSAHTNAPTEYLVFHTRSRTNYPKEEPITTMYSCLLIPVAVGIWWYWTKRAARCVMRGLLTCRPCRNRTRGSSSDHGDTLNSYLGRGRDEAHGIGQGEMDENSIYSDCNHRNRGELRDDDDFCSSTAYSNWQDAVRNAERRDPFVRFIRWILGKDSHATLNQWTLGNVQMKCQQSMFQQVNIQLPEVSSPINSA